MDPQLVQLALALMLVGAAAGFSAGLLGIGGGAIIVPALYYMFGALGYSHDVIMHAAVATSSATIIITSLRSAHSHNKHGAVDWALIWPGNPLKSWGVWIGVGALLAALIVAQYLSGLALTLIFGVAISIIALQFIFGRPGWQLAETVPGGLAIPTVGMGLGGISALMGIGGGALGVTLMMLCGKRIHRAIGTASAIGFFIGFPATIGFIISGWNIEGRPPFSLGYVNLLGFIIVAVMSFLFIPLGVKTVHNLSQKRMRMVFGICLLLVALNMIRKAVTG
jgi:uncharacterized membrane protein YfcA